MTALAKQGTAKEKGRPKDRPHFGFHFSAPTAAGASILLLSHPSAEKVTGRSDQQRRKG